MRCLAFVTATDNPDAVEVRPLTALPMTVEGFDEVVEPGPEVVVVDAEWLEGHELPGYFELDLVDDIVDDLRRLDVTPAQFRRRGATGLLVGNAVVSFTGPEMAGGQPTGSWRDRLLNRGPTLKEAAAPGGRLLIWDGTPSFRQWIDECQRRDREREVCALKHAEQAAERARIQAEEALQNNIDDGAHFVNPYTFVPLPLQVLRSRPAGHERAAEGNLTGYIDASFHLKTPMMLDNDFEPPGDGSPQQVVVRVPGSSIRGAVRSLYEVMTDSCLSVIDADYLPVHRAPLRVDPKARLAVVTKRAEDGSPTHVRSTSRVVWVPALWLHGRFPNHPENLRSGQRITFDEAKVSAQKYGTGVYRDELTSSGRSTIKLAVGAAQAGQWVVHVADAGAKGRHPASRIFVAAGKLEAHDIPLADGAWDDYRARCLGSQDVERGQLANVAPAWTAPEWPGVVVNHAHQPKKGPKEHHVIGSRRKSDGALAEGDSIWIIPTHQRGVEVAAALSMSAAWRIWGKGSVRDRLPDKSLLPCTDPEDLCPACSVFGFVEQRSGKADRGRAREQNAYASHVRFSAFFATDGPVGVQQIHPPPMRSPRPSAGNFYLAHPDAKPPLRESGDPKLGQSSAQWGANDNPLRKIAGRKFYWHGQQDWDTDPTPRQKRRDHYPEFGTPQNKDAKRWLMKEGSELRGRVYFENITRTQLAFLLMAVDPGRLQGLDGAPDAIGELQTHLGGGKPLGFGSATATVTVVAEDAAGRYLSTTTPLDADELMAMQAPVPPDAHWLPGLAKALSSQAVSANRIWYPTLGNFNRRATTAQQREFDESHKYYAAFSGANKPRQVEPLARMRTLPNIDEASQFMSNEHPGEQ